MSSSSTASGRAYVESRESDSDSGNGSGDSETIDKDQACCPNVACKATRSRLTTIEARCRTVTKRSRQPRLTEASLVQVSSKRAASADRAPTRRSSRPSWRATTASRRARALVPTWTAFAVVQACCTSYLVAPGRLHVHRARWKNDLDEISNGRPAAPRRTCAAFFLGNGQPGTEEDRLDRGAGEGHRPARSCAASSSARTTKATLVEVRVGRYGPFLSVWRGRASACPDQHRRRTSWTLASRAGAPRQECEEGPQVRSASTPRSPACNGVRQRSVASDPTSSSATPSQLDGEKPKMASLLQAAWSPRKR